LAVYSCNPEAIWLGQGVMCYIGMLGCCFSEFEMITFEEGLNKGFCRPKLHA